MSKQTNDDLRRKLLAGEMALQWAAEDAEFRDRLNARLESLSESEADRLLNSPIV